jgi:hypothetical protein
VGGEVGTRGFKENEKISTTVERFQPLKSAVILLETISRAPGDLPGWNLCHPNKLES